MSAKLLILPYVCDNQQHMYVCMYVLSNNVHTYIHTHIHMYIATLATEYSKHIVIHCLSKHQCSTVHFHFKG